MSTKLFVNLSVKDLDKSKEFYEALGYSINPQFTDANAACVVISDDIFVMLLTEPFFKDFINKEIADSSKSTEAIITLSADTKSEVDALADRALAAGGQQVKEPMVEGPMYGRSFYDIDGHHWEVMYMNPSGLQS